MRAPRCYIEENSKTKRGTPIMTNRKNWPVGLSTSHFGSLAHRESEVFSEYRKAGIRVAELSQPYAALVEAGF